MPDFIPQAFPVLALAHFLALLSPGPDFFLVVGHAVRHRLRGTLFLCAGIALGNALYIAAAITGWSAIRRSPFLYGILEIAGALYLIRMGHMLIRSGGQRADVAPEGPLPPSPARQLAIGLGSALLNPKNAVFYLTLMTVIIGAKATLAQQIFSGIWMSLLVFCWDAGLAAVIAHPTAQRILKKGISLVERMAGIFLILLAFSLTAHVLIHPSAG